MSKELMENVGKLAKMAIDNGKERDEAIARAQAAEAELAKLKSEQSGKPNDSKTSNDEDYSI